MVRKLEEFKNIHKNKDIYIIASGKSLDFINNNFFENKITIGINQAYKKFETKYLLRKEHKFIEEIMNNNKNTIHFISNGNCGNTIKGYKNKNKDFIEKNYKNNDNIILFNHNDNKHILQNLPKDDNKIVVSHSTITSGIHLAAYMGAQNIILVGHNCGTLDGKENFEGYHSNKTRHQKTRKDYINWLKLIEKDTILLKKLLKEKYGCNVYSLNPFINFGLEGHIYRK